MRKFSRRGICPFGVAGIIGLIAAILALFGITLPGCAPNTEPIERSANTMVEKVIVPAVQKAGQELGARTAQYQGQGSLINPGYVINGYGVFGTGIVYELSMRAEGLSANVAGATQQDKGTAAIWPPGTTTQPVTPAP